jgi:5'(3')-deoxyribonucleotidase
MKKQQFVLGVDLDGVVADFYEGIRPLAAEWLGVPEESLKRDVAYGLPEWALDRMGGTSEEAYERFHRFAVTQRNLFRDLPPIHGAPAALRRISAIGDDDVGIRIRIITHRLYIKYFHKSALVQTIDWLEHHGIPYWDLCLMKEKAAVGADLYIEDSPTNIRDLRDAGNEVIVFSNSTNLEVAEPRASDWTHLEHLVRERFKDWRRSLMRKPPKPRPRVSGSRRSAKRAA